MPPMSATGEWPPKGQHPHVPHHDGFDFALQDALAKLSADVGTGDYTVQVEYSADVHVSNPGSIGLYKVKVTQLPAAPAPNAQP